MNRFTVREKRRFRRSFFVFSTVWSLGNAFASGAAVLLLLFHLGGLPWGTAAMHAFIAPIVGNLFRIFSPLIQKICPKYRTLSVSLYLLQAACLCSAALLCWFTRENFVFLTDLFLILWYAGNICESLAYVTLLVWVKSLFHRNVLGRFFALRERWRLAGEICILSLGGLMFASFREICFGGNFPAEYHWVIYPGFLFCAGIFSGCSIWYLRKIPNLKAEETLPAASSGPGSLLNRSLRSLGTPLKDPVFRCVVLYGLLFAFCTQAELPVRCKFQHTLLHENGLVFLWITSGLAFVTRGGQILAAPLAGKFVDRFGTLRVMGMTQMLTAFAYFFYICAVWVPNFWLMYGAAAVWISYVGLNTALPKFLVERAGSCHVSRPAVYGFFSGIGGICGAFFGRTILGRFPWLMESCLLLFTVFLSVRLLLSLPIFAACWISRKDEPPKPSE